MKVIVAGSRGITDYEFIRANLDHVLPTLTPEPVIVSGTARGVDQMGERYAIERGLRCERFPANWDLYGKRAGYIRNEQMAKYADALVVFWDGVSRGTKHMMDIATKAGLTVVIIGENNARND